MGQVQNIRIKYIVDDSDLDKADRSVDKLTASEKALKAEFDKVNASANKANNEITEGSKKASGAVNSLSGGFKNLGGTIAAAFSLGAIIAFGNKLIEITGTYQKYQAVLANTLGNQALAKAQLSDLADQAVRSNFSLEQLTQGYIKLVNQGFNPTRSEMTKLQDLANSTGKEFDQLVEGIIDAQTGEFERLKEFGIRASKEGDNVKFTFKGVEAQTKFTASAIRDYVLSLGDLEGVTGSTAAISSTLTGQMSNLGDSFDQFFATLGKSGTSILTKIVAGLNEAVQLATDFVKLGDESVLRENLLGKNVAIEIEAANERINNLIGRGKSSADAYKQVLEELAVMIDKVPFANSTDDGKQRFDELSAARQAIINQQKDLSVKEAQAAKDTKKAEEEKRKELDKSYQKELQRLRLQEQNALREGKLVNDSKVYLLDIENNYNEKRMALFRRFSQTNLDELKSYQIREKEILVETIDAKAENAAKYQKLESKKVEAVGATSELIKNVDFTEANRRYQEYLDDVNAFKKAQERKKEIYRAFYTGLLDVFYTFQENQKIETQNEIQGNNIARQQELQQYEGNKQAQASINAKYDSMNRRLQREQAQRDKEVALFNIGIGKAQAVVKALPNFILAGVVAAFGAIQLGMVASRPLPKFAKGVEKLSGEGTETSDSIHALLSRGERVVPASTNRDYFPALTAIHNRHIPPELMNGFAMNYGAIQGGSVVVSDNSKLESKLDKIVSKMDNIKQVNITVDKNGVSAFLETKYSRTEFVNNYVTK